MDPIIVLGMHRSGTSLVSELMQNAGVFMGKNLNSHNESVPHLRLNQELLRMAHADWDNPTLFNFLLNSKLKKDKAVEMVLERVSKRNFSLAFFGKRAWINKRPRYWGWKEPRTTITFPIWKEIYPNAKYIILYRNGVDVANSLYVREKSRENTVRDYFSVRCLSLEESFKLWEEYNEFMLEYLPQIPEGNVYELKYENLLRNPEEEFEKLFKNFLMIKNAELQLQDVDPQKAYKFVTNNELVKFYSKVKNNKTMESLGYGNIV